MNTSRNRSDDVLITLAAWEIAQHIGKPVSPDSVRQAAKRIQQYRKNANGYGVISRALLDEMKGNYAALGFFTRRKQVAMEVTG